MARAAPKAIEAERDGASVGPISLASLAWASTSCSSKVTDKLGKREIVQEAPLEVLP